MFRRSSEPGMSHYCTIVQDEGFPPLNGTILATVRVDPVPPIFEQFVYTASVDEFSGEVYMFTSTIINVFCDNSCWQIMPF